MSVQSLSDTRYRGITLEMMDLVGDKWTLLIVYTLAEGAIRFSELRRRAAPISQKMLTQTLRGLERHGLVDRHVLSTMPPRVEYALTALGESFLVAASTMCAWTRNHCEQLEGARLLYDRREGDQSLGRDGGGASASISPPSAR